MRLRLLWLAVAVVTLLIALAPPIDDAAHEGLQAHMVQHLLLSMVAAPALAAAGPIGLVLARTRRTTARGIVRALRAPAMRRLVHPATTTVVFAVTLAVVHRPAFYDAALRHPALHALEHAGLFWTAVLFWLPLIGRDPLPRAGAVARLVAGLLGMAAMVVVGGAISAAPHPLYPSYGEGSAALADQQLAGGLMVIGGMLVMLPLLLWSAWAALTEDERRELVRERLAERRADGVHGV